MGSPLISIKPSTRIMCVNVNTECHDLISDELLDYEICADYELAIDGWQKVNIIHDNIQENKLTLNFPDDAYKKKVNLYADGITATGNICKAPRRKRGKVYLTTPDMSNYNYWVAN